MTRTKQLQIRVSTAELELIKRNAEMSGQNVSDYAREALMIATVVNNGINDMQRQIDALSERLDSIDKNAPCAA